MGDKKVSLKFGQLAADSEFFNTKYTDAFTNASIGWPAITSLDLPSGGPSPPLAAMGARLLVNITDQLSVLGGIFDGNQAGPGPGDPQERNRYGVNFRINDPPLLLGQIQYAWNNKKGDPNLTGQVKLGGWRHFGQFSDLQLASNGVSLSAPTSSGTPLMLGGDIGGWAVFEQQLYRVPKSDDRGIGIFARVSGAPADRNLIDLYADTGLEFIGLRTNGRTTSSVSRLATRMSRSEPRRSTLTIAHSPVRRGRRGASKDSSRRCISISSRTAGPSSPISNTSSGRAAERRTRRARCRAER